MLQESECPGHEELHRKDKTLRQLTGGTFFLNNLFVLALVYASTALPFTIYLLSGYFRSLAKDFEEAAYVDGASYFTTMVKIIFPMAKPSIVTVILFSFLSFWNEYIIALTLMPGKNQTLPVGLKNLIQAQRGAAEYGQLLSLRPTPPFHPLQQSPDWYRLRPE